MRSSPPSIARVWFAVALCGVLLLTAGCYRREVRRRSWPGFAAESNATPAPRAETPHMQPLMTQKSDPLADVGRAIASPFASLFRGIGSAFSSGKPATPPQPGGPEQPTPGQPAPAQPVVPQGIAPR